MSDALKSLAARLSGEARFPGGFGSDDLTSIREHVERLRRTVTEAVASVDDDLSLKAVRQFWASGDLDSLRDARLVCFGLHRPVAPSGPCIMEDRDKLHRVLDDRAGVGQWMQAPRRFRRCYQGLVRSYFSYDAYAARTPTIGRRNWQDLRSYLRDHRGALSAEATNPAWVGVAQANGGLFSEEPCAEYAHDVLAGDGERITSVRQALGIPGSSWFLSQLILSSVRAATKLEDAAFKGTIPLLLPKLREYQLLRTDGLASLLDRYADCDDSVQDVALRDRAVEWWGNPWLPSTEAAWGRVTRRTREMVSVWLKSELIDEFFKKLASNNVGDRRRSKFWLRYVKSMDVRFALGADALSSRDKDFVALRQKMKGLFTPLHGGLSSNNAFIMRIGKLTAVEFGDSGNAFYAYDSRNGEPFDLDEPVTSAVDGENSLKSSDHLFKLRHQDVSAGLWEEVFERRLKSEFRLKPDEAAMPAQPQPRAERPPAAQLPTRYELVPFSQARLREWASNRGFDIEDLSARGGNIWVRTLNRNTDVNRVLTAWGFRFRNDKGWWR
jgi:hypothetical protein